MTGLYVYKCVGIMCAANTVAIETSCRQGSVAVSDGANVLAEAQFSSHMRHAAELLPTIRRLVAEQHWQPNAVDRIAVSIGPGSFTGLRIGVTFARTLSTWTGASIIAVPTVDVIAATAEPVLRQTAGDRQGYLAVILDAKRRQVYAALYRWTGSVVENIIPARLTRVPALLGDLDGPVWVTGEGVDYHLDDIEQYDVHFLSRAVWTPHAAMVARVGNTLAEAGSFVDADRLTPLYLRLPEAEERRLAREGTLPDDMDSPYRDNPDG